MNAQEITISEPPGRTSPLLGRGQRAILLQDAERASAAPKAMSREIPRRRMVWTSVVLFIPSRAAAPLGPPTTQLVRDNAFRICSRSASSRVMALAAPAPAGSRAEGHGRGSGPPNAQSHSAVPGCCQASDSGLRPPWSRMECR